VAALRPDKLTCNRCQTDFTEFETLDTRGLPGIEMACVGKCPKCGEVTWGVKGDPAACEAFVHHVMHEEGVGADEVTLGVQKIKNGEGAK
jgi:hypothetical protein